MKRGKYWIISLAYMTRVETTKRSDNTIYLCRLSSTGTLALRLMKPQIHRNFIPEPNDAKQHVPESAEVTPWQMLTNLHQKFRVSRLSTLHQLTHSNWITWPILLHYCCTIPKMYLRRTKSQAYWLTPNWWEASTPVAILDQGCQLKSSTEQGCTCLCSIPWTLDPD